MPSRCAAVAAVFLLVAAAAVAQDDDYLSRRAALTEGDHEALFELGMWCLNRGGSLDGRARECFEDLLGAPGAVRDRAAWRLALWHLNRGRGYADARIGVELLADLVRRGSEVPAARDLEAQRLTLGAQKRDETDKARRSLGAGHVLAAARALAQVRRLPFGEGTGDADLGDRALFDLIARAQSHAESEAARYDDPKLPVACPKCAASGFEDCGTCKGKGTVTQKTKGVRVLTENGLEYRPGKVVTVKCGSCGGSGKEPCKTCRATGMDASLFDEDARRNIIRFGGWLKSLSSTKDPVRAVERAFEETVDSRLRAPAALKASVAFPLVPPVRAKMDVAALEQFWKDAADKEKIDLLRGITLLSARWLEPFFFQAHSRKTLGVKEPFREKAYTVPLPPEIVAADPDGFDDQWVRVFGEIESVRAQGPWPDDVAWITVKGEGGPHNLKFFLWREKSREKHAILSELHKDFQHLKRSLWTYPFTLETEVARLPVGMLAVFYGRTVKAPGFSPSHAVELWAVEPVADRARVVPPKTAPLDPATGETRAEKAALHHGRALDALRSTGPDAADARTRALADLRAAIEHYQAALAEEPEDVVLQESHARTLDLLHRLLAGKSWPR